MGKPGPDIKRQDRRRRFARATLLLAAVVLAACGERAAPRATPPVAASAASTATTVAPTVTTPTQLPETTPSPANVYLRLIAPANEMVAMYDAASDPTDKAQDLRELSGLLGVFAAEIQSTTWPTPTANAIAGLVTAAHGARTAVDLLITNPSAQTAAEFSAAVGTLSAASSRVRLLLGLPPLG